MIKLSICIIAILVVIYIIILKEDTFDPVTEIKGKNVIVTGASQGIGEQIAYNYARMGANVFLTARRENLLKQVTEKCRKIGHNDAIFGYLPADMEMYEETASKIIDAAMKLFGGIDHVILNHAYVPGIQKWNGTEEQLRIFKKSMDVNTVSYVHLVSHVLPHLRNSKHARLGVISSLAGKCDAAFQASYSSSKFALDGFFSALRLEFELHKENITVTLCNLGFIGNDLGHKMRKDFMKAMDVNLDSFPFSVLFPCGNLNDTSLEIIKSTARGEKELYYPPALGSKYIVRMFPIIRHLF